MAREPPTERDFDLVWPRYGASVLNFLSDVSRLPSSEGGESRAPPPPVVRFPRFHIDKVFRDGSFGADDVAVEVISETVLKITLSPIAADPSNLEHEFGRIVTLTAVGLRPPFTAVVAPCGRGQDIDPRDPSDHFFAEVGTQGQTMTLQGPDGPFVQDFLHDETPVTLFAKTDDSHFVTGGTTFKIVLF